MIMKTRFFGPFHVITNLAIALLLGWGFFFVVMFMGLLTDPLLPRVQGDEPAVQWEVPMVTTDGEFQMVNPSHGYHSVIFGGQIIHMPNSIEPVDPYALLPKDKGGLKLAPKIEFVDYPKETIDKNDQLNVFSSQGSWFEIWYLIKHSHPEQHGYFVGYEKKSQRLLGFIGRNGFQADRPSVEESLPLLGGHLRVATANHQMSAEKLPEPWTEPSAWEFDLQANRKIWMATTEGIWQCDLGSRSVKPFALVGDIRALYVMMDHGKRQQTVVVRTKDGLQLLNEAGEAVSKVDYPLVGNDFLTLSLTESGNSVLVVTKNPKWVKETSRTVSISWFDRTGKRFKEVSQPLKSHVLEDSRFNAMVPIVAVNRVTMALCGAFAEIMKYLTKTVKNEEDWLPRDPVAYRIFAAVATMLATCWLWWHQARNRSNLGQVAIWTGFVVLFGVIGLLGYLFHRRWPALVRCQQCGRKNFAGESGCPHCGNIVAEHTILGRDMLQAEITPMLAQSA